MISIDKKENCSGCYACEQICPVKAIIMQQDKEGFEYPKVNVDVCIRCGMCERVCPEKGRAETSSSTSIYAAYRVNHEKRMQSQSGGIFAILAEKVIRHGGIVYGAAFDAEWRVCHQRVENAHDLNKLLGSKYSQSKMGSVFSEIKRELSKNKLVLFSGTPCQVQGLVKYLGRKEENLLLVDLICHGVGSPKVWNSYLHEYINGDVLDRYVQKDKNRKNSVVFYRKNKGMSVESYDKNTFTRGYSRNLFLRPSCYSCSFKGIERCSDISLGDFWGLEKFYPEFVDRYGISAVMVHTENGAKWFEQIKEGTRFIECTAEMLTKENPSICGSTVKNKNRDLFFENLETQGVIVSVRKYAKDPLKRRIRDLYWSVNDTLRVLAYRLIKGK